MLAASLAAIIAIVCPLMINALFSKSSTMVPLNGPCTESYLNKSALLLISLSELLRVTIALNLNCSPLPACITNSLAAILPILPKPYKTTSLGFNTFLSKPICVASFVCTKFAMELKLFFSSIHSEANLPRSMRDGAMAKAAISLAMARVSSISMALPIICCAYK